MIDPQESCITKLSKTKQINTTNILRVHTKNTQLNFTNIAKTLTKGNCAAIVVCDAQFDKQQLNTLEACAKQGNSQCVLLKTNTELH